MDRKVVTFPSVTINSDAAARPLDRGTTTADELEYQRDHSQH